MNVRDTKIWIVGAARSGIAAARILHMHGARLFVTDAGPIEPEQKKILGDLGIPFEEGGHSTEKLLREAQLVVLSPSIPLDKPLPLAVRQAGIPLVGEIEIASWFLPSNAIVIGITGTNGKSTTTHYTAQLFELGHKKAVACGNIGRPLADAILDAQGYDTFIVEFSSYQLETTTSLRPMVSMLLNLQNDHLARYGTIDEYLKAKWRLILLTRPDGLAIVDEPVFRRALVLGLARPSCRIAILNPSPESFGAKDIEHDTMANAQLRSFGEDNQVLPLQLYGQLAQLPIEKIIQTHCADINFVRIEKRSDGQNTLRFQVLSNNRSKSEVDIAIDTPCLPGEHNQLNIASASLAALHAGLAPSLVAKQWNASSSVYHHLAHRLEDVCKGDALKSSDDVSKDVRVINDSKATNVESTIVAVKSFAHSIRLLLGGEPKGDLYSDLLPFIGTHICKIYPFGKASTLICEQLASRNEYLAPSSGRMTDAAQMALDDAQAGDVILLSPACASFDEFKNFEHRGDVFKAWANGRKAH